MNDILKMLLSGAAGYALGSRYTDDDVKTIIDAYLRAVTLHDLLEDYRRMKGINEGDSHYVDELSRLTESAEYERDKYNYGMGGSYC